MSLYKRPKSPFWWARFTVNGERVQRSTGTTDRRLASQLLAKWRTEAWQQQHLGMKAAHTWDEAVMRFLDETQFKRSRATDLIHLRWLQPHLENRELTQINRDRTELLMQVARSEGASSTTINRRMQLLRNILNRAANDWEWIDKAPRIRMQKEPPPRERYLTHEEALRLMGELREHQRGIVMFAIVTGLRQGNVKHLRWTWINFETRLLVIPADSAKGGKPIPVPLENEALAILLAHHGQHPEFVFTYRGQPVTQVSTKAWRAALKRAELHDVRFHDLRHTFASVHAQNGTPDGALQALGGWRDAAMVRRYAHLNVEHLRPHVRKVGALFAPLLQATGYIPATPKEVH